MPCHACVRAFLPASEVPVVCESCHERVTICVCRPLPRKANSCLCTYAHKTNRRILLRGRLASRPWQQLYSYGMNSYSLFRYGLFIQGLFSSGRFSYGLSSYGLSSYGLYSYGLLRGHLASRSWPQRRQHCMRAQPAQIQTCAAMLNAGMCSLRNRLLSHGPTHRAIGFLLRLSWVCVHAYCQHISLCV